jgi:hypothetical protein
MSDQIEFLEDLTKFQLTPYEGQPNVRIEN